MAEEVKYLEESPLALTWLSQFIDADRELARQFLRQLRLVSESEFEQGMQQLLSDVVSSSPSENFALFPVTEPPNQYVAAGGRRTPGSSSDRIRHLIENTHRVHGDRVSAVPTVSSMRAQRIRNVVLVEDFVGSGTRLKTFWKTGMSKSLKSWISYGWTTVWLVTYAAFGEGLRVAKRVVKGLSDNHIKIALSPDSTRLGLTRPMKPILERYGRKAESSRSRLGYGRGGATIVFQHGCPNNAPLVLWADATNFRPLFPNRGIPAELHEYFGQPVTSANAELLWKWNQYKLALNLLDSLGQARASPAHWGLVMAIGLSSRHRTWDDEWLAKVLRITLSEVTKLKRRAYSLHLIDPSSHTVTSFGREMLDRLRSSSDSNSAHQHVQKTPQKLDGLYYPDSCRGKNKH